MKKIPSYFLNLMLAIGLTCSSGPTVYAASVKPQTSTLVREELVDFNTSSHKFHSPSCKWAIKCTSHCIKIPRSEALNRGGIPCKVCGGR